ncbi:MAG TPA: magnesium transporter [Bacteroidota bacterium]|nr:magnesium transporter [Bacteroidota bacterium]
MLGRAILPEINELIRSRDFQTLKEIFEDWHPSELADAVSDLSETDRAVVFRLLPKEKAADVFEYLNLEVQEPLLKAMGQDEVGAILNEMSPDDRTALLQELPGPVVRHLLELLTPAERRVAQTLLGYPASSVCRLMTSEYIAVTKDWSVQRVLGHIRKHGRGIESLDFIYVLDEKGKLIDDIRMHDVVVAPLRSAVSKLMDESFVCLKSSETKEDAVQIFKKYDRSALPVVDKEGFLLGIVTIDDALDLVEEIDTKDIQKFGGLEALEYPYVRTPVLELVKKRAGWLVILFLGEMLTATAMGYFEAEIAKAVVLALFVPLIISSGGNSGSQAATLIIRAMALQEITIRDWWFVMRREIFSGLMLGLVLGSIGFLRIGVWSAFSTLYGPHWILVALTVSSSLVGIVMWGTLSGSMLPFVLRRLGFDPASSSAPFVATLVDVTGLVIYFSFAAMILHGTML